MVREPILLRSVLHDREIEVALTMARIEPLSTQPGPLPDKPPARRISTTRAAHIGGYRAFD